MTFFACPFAGGICWGLKHVFGDHVHVFYAEPTHAPCVLLGLASGLDDGISVQGCGLDGVTIADGLAVGRCSALCCEMTKHLVSGVYTVHDSEMLEGVRGLWKSNGVFVEPSCAAAFVGVQRLQELSQDPLQHAEVRGYAQKLVRKGVHVFWMTGGDLVPAEERAAVLGSQHVSTNEKQRSGA